MNIKTKQVAVWYTLTLGTKFTVNVPEGLEGDAVELYIQRCFVEGSPAS